MNKILLTSLAIVGVCSFVQAQTVVVVDGSAYANLVSISVDGTTYSGSDLIGVDITAFNMSATSNFDTYQIVPTGTGPFTGSAATALMDDMSLATGYAGLANDAFSFLSPVVNIAGPEIFIFEYNPSESNEFDITLNGNTVSLTPPAFATSSPGDVTVDLLQNFAEAADIAALESLDSADYSVAFTQTNPIGVLAVDLSDYGVSAGGSVSDIVISGSNDWDVTAVFGVGVSAVPEPSAFGAIAGLFGLLMVVSSRRRARA